MRKKRRASGFSRLAADHWRMNGVRPSEVLPLAAAGGVSSRIGSSGAGEDGAAADWRSAGCTIVYRLPWRHRIGPVQNATETAREFERDHCPGTGIRQTFSPRKSVSQTVPKANRTLSPPAPCHWPTILFVVGSIWVRGNSV